MSDSLQADRLSQARILEWFAISYSRGSSLPRDRTRVLQRIARRDKKAFLSDQCKEIEENNRMGKTRDLFKKIRDTKGTFHAKNGLDKGQK